MKDPSLTRSEIQRATETSFERFELPSCEADIEMKWSTCRRTDELEATFTVELSLLGSMKEITPGTF